MEKLQELHPDPVASESITIQSTSGVRSWVPHLEDEAALQSIRKAIKSFQLGSGAGPSGLWAEHLLNCAVLWPSDSADRLCTLFVRLAVFLTTEDVPQEIMQVVAAAKLIALKKPGGGVRPIAVGEVLRRLVGKLIAGHTPMKDVARQLAPLQVGIGISGACECVAMGVGRPGCGLEPPWFATNRPEEHIQFRATR